MNKVKNKIFWNQFRESIVIFSIIFMVYLSIYSRGLLYTDISTRLLNIGIFVCVIIQSNYFGKVNIEMKKIIRIIIGAGVMATMIIADTILVKGVCVLLLLYLCLSNRIQVIRRVIVPISILVCVLVGVQVSEFISIRYKSVSIIQYLIKGILNIGGISANIINEFLAVNIDGKMIKYSVTFDAMMLYSFSIVFIVLWLFILKRHFNNFIKLISGFLGIIIIRFLILIIIYNYWGKLDVFWDILLNLLICMILTFIQIRFLERREREEEYIINLNIETFALYALGSVAIIMLVLGHRYGSIGEEKQGRVLIDEWHSEGWESIDEPLNTTEYLGQKSVYTYTSMVDLLSKLYTVTIGQESDVLFSLEDYDILILKTPTKAFIEEEINQIQSFMENGGGVFLIGDHTNLFNMNKYLNDISGEYGIKLNYDSVYDIRDGGFVNYKSENMKSQSTAGVEEYKFATSCSIEPDIFTRIEMYINNGCTEKMDISQVNFFGNMIPEPSEKWGPICVAASKEVGKGRLFVFSDSTTFSSFSMFMHDNPEFLVGIMEFLNYKNLVNLYYVICLGSIICILALFIKKRKVLQVNICIFSLLVICMLGTLIFYAEYIDGKNSKSISSKLDTVDTIFFLEDNKLSHFIGYDFLKENYQSLFLDIQRQGKILREKESIEDCVKENSEAIFITNIDRELTKDEKVKLENYVSKGEKVIFLESSVNSKKSMSDLLHTFGISKINQKMFYEVLDGENEEEIKLEHLNTQYYSKQGSVLKDIIYSDYPINFNMHVFQYKKGMIFIINDAYYLTNQFMGDQGTPTSKEEYNLHQALHKLVNEIF